MFPPEPKRPYLVVCGQSFNVDEFLTDFGPIAPDLVFHRGEVFGDDDQPSPISGFFWHLNDADEEYWKQATNLERFLHEHYIGLSSIRNEATCAAVIFLYNRPGFDDSSRLDLEPSLMGMLAGLNFELIVRSIID